MLKYKINHDQANLNVLKLFLFDFAILCLLRFGRWVYIVFLQNAWNLSWLPTFSPLCVSTEFGPTKIPYSYVSIASANNKYTCRQHYNQVYHTLLESRSTSQTSSGILNSFLYGIKLAGTPIIKGVGALSSCKYNKICIMYNVIKCLWI